MEMEDHDPKGLIFKIDRFCLQDGPGIRTMVFMKGCPLRCRWCSNPESQNPYSEIMVNNIRCTQCGRCADVCPHDAIIFEHGIRKINRLKCDNCLKCADVCPTQAISAVGMHISVEEVMREVKADEIFYNNSGGGLTVSGGEPLIQWRFVNKLLKECQIEGINTAIETSGYTSKEIFEEALSYIDLVLFDVKHLTPMAHKKGTGRSNKRILENLYLVSNMARIWLRFPIIPGYNDTEENIHDVIDLAKNIGAEKVSLLPYHDYGAIKYKQLGRRYSLKKLKSSDDDYILEIKKKFLGNMVKATIGY
ncbi:MAG: glycyl-radical enzyme activating protein [Thermodesulfobacteriota bacterium]|nr:glycyl-radical enzyme activating protein [Thermodesulfobacteriota bacterium]